ncbi:MAG TPA: hypothetical protein VFQ39_19225 [Longimicrobium sp.]|nr:hypothetical protein [Longimicrobium sp.]
MDCEIGLVRRHAVDDDVERVGAVAVGHGQGLVFLQPKVAQRSGTPADHMAPNKFVS